MILYYKKTSGNAATLGDRMLWDVNFSQPVYKAVMFDRETVVSAYASFANSPPEIYLGKTRCAPHKGISYDMVRDNS